MIINFHLRTVDREAKNSVVVTFERQVANLRKMKMHIYIPHEC